jgi:hypothetical protein
MEIRAATTLRRKRKDCERIAALYERQIARVRADIEAIDATISVLEGSGDPKKLAAHVDVYRLFRTGELIALCKTALQDGPMTLIEMITYIMRSKGMDTRDVVLAKNLERRLVNALGQQRRRMVIEGVRKGSAARVWRLRG